jgi:hypothetical protein
LLKSAMKVSWTLNRSSSEAARSNGVSVLDGWVRQSEAFLRERPSARREVAHRLPIARQVGIAGHEVTARYLREQLTVGRAASSRSHRWALA